MNLQRILNSRGAGVWALRISRLLSPAVGLPFSRLVAGQIAARRHLPLVRAIRLNRWVVSGCTLSPAELDVAVRAVMCNIARSYYTLFHLIHDPAALQRQVAFSPEIEALIARSQQKKHGVVVAGVHLSNFDLVLQAASWHGLRGLALTLPDSLEIREAVEWQHIFRRQSGIELLPASLPNFRQAIRRLQAGETVLTGIDRPVSLAKHYPHFFGHPAHVPVHYIQLAEAARAPLMVFAAKQDAHGDLPDLFDRRDRLAALFGPRRPSWSATPSVCWRLPPRLSARLRTNGASLYPPGLIFCPRCHEHRCAMRFRFKKKPKKQKKQKTKDIRKHKRILDTFTGPLERPLLQWLAARQPAWVTPDMLTAVSIVGAVIIFISFILTNYSKHYLWLATLGFIINWYGDSLDGTLARFRHIERPIYGFYLDHTADAFVEMLIFLGLRASRPTCALTWLAWH